MHNGVKVSHKIITKPIQMSVAESLAKGQDFFNNLQFNNSV